MTLVTKGGIVLHQMFQITAGIQITQCCLPYAHFLLLRNIQSWIKDCADGAAAQGPECSRGPQKIKHGNWSCHLISLWPPETIDSTLEIFKF